MTKGALVAPLLWLYTTRDLLHEATPTNYTHVGEAYSVHMHIPSYAILSGSELGGWGRKEVFLLSLFFPSPSPGVRGRSGLFLVYMVG